MDVSDRNLLRKYEPVLRFSGGKRRERFYPIRIEDYLANCTLWQTRSRLGKPEEQTEWSKLPTGRDRAEALSEFSNYDSYLFFNAKESNMIIESPNSNSSALGCLIMTTLCLGLAWGSATVGHPWLAGALVYILVFSLVLLVSGEILTRANREYPIGIAQTLKELSHLIFSISLIPPIIGIAWWLGGATWGWPVLGISVFFIFVIWIPSLVIDQNAQLIAMAMALFSPIKKRETEAAQVACKDLSPCYYGRVWRPRPSQQEQTTGEELVLQYFFFYALNDWPTHGGSNYHQGDWEAVFVYLKKQNGIESLTHLGLSAHHVGQAWEWTNVETEPVGGQEHPVVYVAAGSHANYRKKGEEPFQNLLPVERKNPLYKVLELLDRRWRYIRERIVDVNKESRERWGKGYSKIEEPVPTKEYHEGNGRIIGPRGLQFDQEFIPWPEPVLLEDRELPGWVENYRGLWGFKTPVKDVSGPPGPKWNRQEDVKKHGEERLYWQNPIEWINAKGVLQTLQNETTEE